MLFGCGLYKGWIAGSGSKLRVSAKSAIADMLWAAVCYWVRTNCAELLMPANRKRPIKFLYLIDLVASPGLCVVMENLATACMCMGCTSVIDNMNELVGLGLEVRVTVNGLGSRF